MITRMTGKNQVTVPAAIVGKAGLKPGTRLDWRTTDRDGVLEVHVLPDAKSLAENMRGRGNSSRRAGGSVVQDLIEEREREDQERGLR